MRPCLGTRSCSHGPRCLNPPLEAFGEPPGSVGWYGPAASEQTPGERIGQAVVELEAALRADLLDRVRRMSVVRPPRPRQARPGAWEASGAGCGAGAPGGVRRAGGACGGAGGVGGGVSSAADIGLAWPSSGPAGALVRCGHRDFQGDLNSPHPGKGSQRRVPHLRI